MFFAVDIGGECAVAAIGGTVVAVSTETRGNTLSMDPGRGFRYKPMFSMKAASLANASAAVSPLSIGRVVDDEVLCSVAEEATWPTSLGAAGGGMSEPEEAEVEVVAMEEHFPAFRWAT